MRFCLALFNGHKDKKVFFGCIFFETTLGSCKYQTMHEVKHA